MFASLLASVFLIIPSALTCLDNALGDPRNEFKHNDASEIRPRSYQNGVQRLKKKEPVRDTMLLYKLSMTYMLCNRRCCLYAHCRPKQLKGKTYVNRRGGGNTNTYTHKDPAENKISPDQLSTSSTGSRGNKLKRAELDQYILIWWGRSSW